MQDEDRPLHSIDWSAKGVDEQPLERVFLALHLDERARAACVCRAWRDALAKPTLWAHLDFARCCASVDDAALARLCARAGAALLELRLDRGPHVRVTAAGLLAALRDGGCVGLQRIWAPLERRDRKGLPTGRWELTPDAAKDLAAVCPRLERVECAVGCRGRGGVDAAVAFGQLEAPLRLPGPLTLIVSGGQDSPDKDEMYDLLQHNVAALELENQTVGNNGAAWLGTALRDNTTLTSLRLWSNRIFDEGAAALGEALRGNVTLSSLNFDGNSIGDAGTVSLAEALRVNTSLTSLKLSFEDGGAAGAAALAEALRHNATLTSLHLSWCSDSGPGAAAIGEALRLNAKLKSLILRSSSIGVEGAAALAKALQANVTLTSLNLEGSCIGDEGAIALGKALCVNATLLSLFLGYNNIGAAGAASLAEALRTNVTLSWLELTRNCISNVGASFLAEALRMNSTLTMLELSRNFIGPEGAAALAAALRSNATLSYLSLRSNCLGATGAASMALALRLSTTLTLLDIRINSIGAPCAALLGGAMLEFAAQKQIDFLFDDQHRESNALDASSLGGERRAPAVMISYRVRETGGGGDNAVFALQKALESRGYSVFVGESAIRSGACWPTKIQKAVEDCSAFVVLCSTTYGDEAVSPRTARELDLADRLKKPLIPVWHSGPYPPKAVAIYLGGKQRIPTGILMEGYASAGISHERVADELAAALAHAGVRSADATAAEADAAAMAVVGAVAASKDASSNRSNAGGVETALCSPMHENVKAAPTESECTLQAGSEAILRLAVTIDGPESRCRAARARRRRASADTHLS